MTPVIDLDKFALDACPPDKRHYPYWLGWFKGILSQLKRIYRIFYIYAYGSDVGFWDDTTPYSPGDEVLWNYKVHWCVVQSLGGIPPGEGTTDWETICDDFIGANERARFNCQKLTLEWALNRRFKQQLFAMSLTGFIQPNSPTAPTHSTIYITNSTVTYPTFLSGTTEALSDEVSIAGSTGYITTAEVFATSSSFSFDVNIPATVYAQIDVNPEIANSIIKNFLSKYVPAGINYNIVTY